MNFIEKRIIQIIKKYCQENEMCIDMLEVQCMAQEQEQLHGVMWPDERSVAFYFIHHEDGDIEFYLPSQIES